jgi:hypothetical protein
LQSGLSKSPISFTNLLPYDDFEEVYNKTLSNLDKMPGLDNFYKLGVFQRNNWNNDDIVPYRKAKFKQNKSGDWFYSNALNIKDQTIEDATNLGRIPQLMKLSSLARDANKDYLVYSWEVGNKEEKANMRKRGDYSYIKKELFKKVYNGTTPLTTKNFYGTDTYVYKQINAWGDGMKANEFYDVSKVSVIPNGFEESMEVEDADILEYFPYDETAGTTVTKLTEPSEEIVSQTSEEDITLQDGKTYKKIEVDGKLLRKLGYTPEEIGNILKEIC